MEASGQTGMWEAAVCGLADAEAEPKPSAAPAPAASSLQLCPAGGSLFAVHSPSSPLQAVAITKQYYLFLWFTEY